MFGLNYRGAYYHYLGFAGGGHFDFNILELRNLGDPK